MTSIAALGMSKMEEASTETAENLGWHDLNNMADQEIANDLTKRKLRVLIYHVARKGHDCDKQ